MSIIKKGFLLFACLFTLLSISTSYACPQCERDRAAAAESNNSDY